MNLACTIDFVVCVMFRPATSEMAGGSRDRQLGVPFKVKQNIYTLIVRGGKSGAGYE